MTRFVLAPAVLALAAAFPAAAQTNEELLKELRELRERVNQLEQKLQQPPAATPATAAPAAAVPAGQWGMTPEQARELNRIAVKTESLQDSFADQGFKGLKISGQMDPTYIYNRRQDSSSFVFLNNEGGRYTYDNSFFGMVVLDIAKETESGTLWRLTLAPERGAGAIFNSGSIVHEASVSIPLTDLQTRLWIGQIPDWTGYEITLPAGNKLITHNLLFDFMAPTAYTGAVMDVKSGKWWVRGGLANVNSARNGSSQKTPSLIYRVDYAKGEFSGFGFAGLHGKLANFAADQTVLGVDPTTGLPVETAVFPDHIGKSTAANLLELDAYFTRGDWSLFGPGQLRAAEAVGHLQQRRRAARRALVGLVGPDGLQDHAALGDHAAHRLREQRSQRRRPAGLQLRRRHQRHRPRACARRQRRRLRAGRPGQGQQPLCPVAGHQLSRRRERDLQARVPLRRRQPAGLRHPERRDDDRLLQDQPPARCGHGRDLLTPAAADGRRVKETAS
jgi:hypothetical protein